MGREHRGIRLIGGLLALGLGLQGCSCGTSGVQQQRPLMKSDFVADLGDADFLVDFGAVLLGETASKRYRLENVGSAGLAVQIERPTPPFSGDLPSSLSAVDVGGGVELRFSFSPLEEREAPAEQVIEVATNEGGGKTYRLRLRGLGVRATLDCEPAALDFGAALVESTTTRSMTCTNPHAVPIEVSLRSIRGDHAMYFSATAEGISNNLLPIGAGESARIDVEFRARSLGENTATLELRDHLQQPIGSVPLRGRVVSSKVTVEPASCLDFLYVNIGSTATKALTLTNVGDEDIEISRIEVPEDHVDDFSVITPLPLSLAANGGSSQVEIAFHPQQGGSRQLVLGIWTSEGESAIPACVTGFGGGPALACTPLFRDLGAAGIGFPAIARFNCSNVGAAPEGTPIDPLVVRSLTSDKEVFSAQVRNEDGSVGARTRGYRVGETFQIEVAYEPIAEVFDDGLVQVQTNVNRVDLRISGEGRAVEPCDFSLSPPSLRFGVVARGTSRTLELEVRNNGATSCFVSDLRLSGDTNPAFSMEASESVVEVEAGGFARFPVTFAPTAHVPGVRGKVLFEVSNPSRRYQEVELSGASANSCLLVEPLELDFGAGMPGCQAIERGLALSNVCGTRLEISSVELGEAPDTEDFSIVRRPSMPLILEPQAYTEVVIAFDPLELGDHVGTLEVELKPSPAVDDHVFIATLRGEGSLSGRQTDDFSSVGGPMIDILWVIDNSGSMSAYQQRLQDNLPAFMSFATAQRADFHIGVTTTALIEGGSCPGGANGGENGRLFPVDGSHPRILTNSTSNLEAHWKHNVAVGTCFMPNQESALEGAFRALSPPLINEAKDSRYNSPYNDGNAGFLRPGAALSVILVSDAKDYSPKPNQDYIDFFFKLKRGQRDMVRVHAISGPRASEGGCGQAGDKMIDVVEETGGTWLSLCTPANDTQAWTETLEEMSKGVFAFAKRHILRGLPDDVNGDGRVNELDIEVRLNGKVEPSMQGSSRVWTYDPIANAIDFQPLYTPRTGTTITASYDLACR